MMNQNHDAGAKAALRTNQQAPGGKDGRQDSHGYVC
jgi:hypothetical protein